MKTKYDLIKEYSIEQWKEFFDGRDSLSAQASRRGYSYSTAVRYFSADPLFVEFMASFKPVSKKMDSRYKDVVSWCKDAGVVPLFSLDSWVGLVRWDSVNKKTLSNSYKVRCTYCGNEFLTCFKSSVPHLSKCPHCGYSGNGMSKYSKFTSTERVFSQLKELGYTPLFISIKSLNDFYPVRCNKCGTEFSTKLVNDHFHNCPYCKPSKAPDNQLSRITKICNSYDYTFQDTWRGKVDSDGTLVQYKVKCNKCGTLFTSFINGHQMRLCPKCKPADYRSNRERKICTLLDVLGVEYFHNYKLPVEGSTRSIELDVYIPSLRVAFEFNGYYWHNSGSYPHSKPKSYHSDKTTICLNSGIKLYHIWESTSDELCQSIVLSKIGKSQRLYARKLQLCEVLSEEFATFFNQYHVDGNVRATKCFALKDESGIVCALSLFQRMIQSSRTVQWEIARFATRYNTVVVGGYSRLLKKSLEYLKLMGASTLISYCNRDLSPDPEDTVYSKLGFTFLGDSGPIYKYWSFTDFDYQGKHYSRDSIISRQFFQKSKLLKHFESSGLELPNPCTEFSLAESLGAVPCYNSGNFKYKLDL